MPLGVLAIIAAIPHCISVGIDGRVALASTQAMPAAWVVTGLLAM
jgi:hypothetical protein